MDTHVGFLGSLLGSSQQYKYEEAGDLYIEAANKYKLSKQLGLAGQAFEKAANAQIKADSKDEAGNTLVDAFKSFKNEDPASAARVLEQAIEIFTTRGQFRRGANFKMDLAQLYEEDLIDLPKALQAYEDAGDWFETDGAQALANKAFIKSADLNALSGNYFKANDIYKKIVKNSLNNSMSKWSLKDYFFKIVASYLAAEDLVAAEKYLDESLQLDSSFQSTREYKLLTEIIRAVGDGDVEKFSNALYEFDQYSRLDKWRTTILLKVKDTIGADEENLL
ncbi:hypothetical protein WICMUC_005363 [Wickerhamomyces mucosus]|uniref:Vesicular-fusion protein SEC17 n=1 Tax=Wickerhamomyces mucosus TaxID=1378264 RepID=A0A9P8P8E6_9ASCO|nr:hypothetical protein WICMUC_005363 [Wickerhamomyces mucosus]